VAVARPDGSLLRVPPEAYALIEQLEQDKRMLQGALRPARTAMLYLADHVPSMGKERRAEVDEIATRCREVLGESRSP
jgi:hypothetical protein